MANTQAICTSFKKEILKGLHAFGTSVVRASTAKDTFKAAVYLATASLGASTTAYTATGEATGAGYTAGGVAVTNANEPDSGGTTAFWTPSASIVFTGVTFASPVDAVLIYNDTAVGKNAVAVAVFGSVTITAGNFSLSMPVNDATNALLRLT